DATRAAELDKAIPVDQKANRWDEAIARAEELAALRRQVLGPAHFETVNDEWRLKTVRKGATMPGEERAAYRLVLTRMGQGDTLFGKGRYAQAQTLDEKALEINRRLLGDDHPNTAASYYNVAVNLHAQGQYAQAQPLHEKALEIQRRRLGDDHPETARSY